MSLERHWVGGDGGGDHADDDVDGDYENPVTCIQIMTYIDTTSINHHRK